jgi:nitroreductase
MDVSTAIHGRRSIRAYRPEPVDRSVIEDVLWDAVQAPTPPVSGEAPWAFCVIEGVARLAAYGARAKQYASDHQPEGRPWTWVDRPGFEVFWGAPVLVLICGRRGNPEIPFDCCRAGQNLMLAAHARGLGSCWVGAPLPWLLSPGVAQELGWPAGFDPFVAMILGHPAEQPAGQPRPRPVITWCEPKAGGGGGRA